MSLDASILEFSTRHGVVAALVFARTLGMAASAPGWGNSALSWRLRIVWAAVFAAIVAPVVSPGARSVSTAGDFARLALLEAVAGGFLGLSAGLILAAARLAGEIVGAQAGLSASTLLDPESGVESTPLGRLFGWIALGAFLCVDGPFRLARVLVESYGVVPFGGFSLSTETAARAFARVETAFELALRLAAPTALALLIAGLALALIARAAPAFPFWSLAWPVRLALGFFLTALGLIALTYTLANAWNSWLSLNWN